MVINHNISALNTLNQLSKNTKSAQSSLEKLSSGLRINSAADDAAGLAISQKMQAQINGLDQSSTNAQDGISLIQTADGALSETQSILQRMNDLATQSANGTETDVDRSDIQDEITQLTQEIDRIGNTTNFNTKTLLNGGAAVSASITGAAASQISVLGGTADTQAAATVAITAFSTATAASVHSGAYAASTTALSANSTLTLNGKTFSFTTANTAQDVIDAVNNADIDVTASYDSTNTRINFASNETGSSATLTTNIAGTGDFISISAGTVSGSDATITATGSPTYTAKGNTITMTSGTAKGLQFTVSGATGAANLTVNANNGINLQIGAEQGQTMYVSISDMRSQALNVSGLDVSTQTHASAAITTIQSAINQVSTQRATLGAYQNRLEHTINNLSTESQNLSSASSSITDVDMAAEMTNYTKNNILVQSAEAMLAQANQLPQGVLSLLK